MLNYLSYHATDSLPHYAIYLVNFLTYYDI